MTIEEATILARSAALLSSSLDSLRTALSVIRLEEERVSTDIGRFEEAQGKKVWNRYNELHGLRVGCSTSNRGPCP